MLTDGSYPPLRLGPEQIASIVRAKQPPPITAAAALMVDLDANQTLYERYPRVPLPPASTVKVMTAFLALKYADLDDPVTVSPMAAGTPGSRMGLMPGEVVTVQDLLYGLLLASGNDAAVAVAEHVGGSLASFVALMNETAHSLGMADSHFTNPHGLDDPAQVASAADLVTLTRAALAFPAFAHIVATEEAYVAGRSLVNTNHLLTIYPGADGVKTGTTQAAGECLIASVTRAGHRLLVVLLGSQDRYGDAIALLDYAAQGWRWGKVDLPADALAWEADADGHRYRLRVEQPFDIFLPAWQWPLIQPVRSLDSSTPLTGTLPVGSLHLMLAGQVVATAPLTTWLEP